MDTSISRLLNRLRHSYPNGVPKRLSEEHRFSAVRQGQNSANTLATDYSLVSVLFVGEKFSNDDRDLLTRAITKGLNWSESSVMIREIKDLAENSEAVKLTEAIANTRLAVAVVQCGEISSRYQSIIQGLAQPQMILSTVHPRDARENHAQKRALWNTVQQLALLINRSN